MSTTGDCAEAGVRRRRVVDVARTTCEVEDQTGRQGRIVAGVDAGRRRRESVVTAGEIHQQAASVSMQPGKFCGSGGSSPGSVCSSPSTLLLEMS